MWVIFPVVFGMILPLFFLILRIGIVVGIFYLIFRLLRHVFRH